MSHPSLGKKTAVFINIIIIFILTFAILIQTASINEPEVKKNIPLPKTDKLSLIGDIDTQRIIETDNEPNNWLSHGRNYEEQRYSTLEDINKNNIKNLELAWSFDMNSTRALEATPIVDNGIMFLTSEWSIVYAINAETGEEICQELIEKIMDLPCINGVHLMGPSCEKSSARIISYFK